MKEEIQKLIKEKPKHYTKIIKKDPELLSWINKESLVKSSHLPSKIYSALYKESNICPNGQEKRFDRISTGFVRCGPASRCECTRNAISDGVSNTKQGYSDKQSSLINEKRKETMLKRYGVEYNSQRNDLKHLWKKPKITEEAHKYLGDKDWLEEQYVDQERSLVDIADELGVYYGTVGDYCRQYGFHIRQRTRYSREEKEVSEYIRSMAVPVLENDWSVLQNHEIDILVPEYDLGIEVNGLYWHSYHTDDKKPEDRMRHINKTTQADNEGITLIHVTDWEWRNRQEQIKSIIRSHLNQNNRIFARNCQFGQVASKEATEFLKKNHLNGYVVGGIHYGLWCQGELFMILSIGKSRYRKDYKFEVLRSATKNGYTVVGGLSKLLSSVKERPLVSYCDLDKFSGNGYESTGFSLIRETGPGYIWTDGSEVISRYRSQKSRLSQWLPSYDQSLSESENMFSAGFRRYWDCGNKVYLLP